MQRTIATYPDSVTELCLLRLGIQVRARRGFFFAIKTARAIAAASKAAIKDDTGLLSSELYLINSRHFGVLHYWRSFEEMEAWTRRPPHSDWWKDSVERLRTRADFGIYHETYLVPRDKFESVYLNCLPVGVASFGTAGDAVGPDTNSRGRLRMGPKTPSHGATEST